MSFFKDRFPCIFWGGRKRDILGVFLRLVTVQSQAASLDLTPPGGASRVTGGSLGRASGNDGVVNWDRVRVSTSFPEVALFFFWNLGRR